MSKLSVGLLCKGRSHTIDKYFQIFELTDKIALDSRFKFNICKDGTCPDEKKIVERYQDLGVNFEVHDLRNEDINQIGLNALIVICPYTQVKYKDIKVPIIYKEYGVAGIEAGTGFLINKPVYKYADTVITENTFYANLIRKKYPDKDVIVGSPAFDYFYKKYSRPEDYHKSYNPDCVKVLWTPHHSMCPNSSFDRIEGGCYSTFPIYKDYLIGDFLKEFPGVELHIKMHPILKRRYNEYCEYYHIENDFSDWLKKVKSNPRIFIHKKEDYHDLFFDSDIVLNDSISFIEEYLPLNKAMWILESDDKSKYSEFGEHLIDKNYIRVFDKGLLRVLVKRFLQGGEDALRSVDRARGRVIYRENNSWLVPPEPYCTFSDYLLDKIYQKYSKESL